MKRTDYSVTMRIFIYIHFQSNNPQGSLYSAGRGACTYAISVYRTESQMIHTSWRTDSQHRWPMFRGHRHGHEQAKQASKLWQFHFFSSFISDPHEMNQTTANHVLRWPTRFPLWSISGQWVAIDLNMAFYSDYSVQVRTHALVLCTIYGELVLTRSTWRSQVNQSINPQRPRPSQNCRGGLVDDHCRAGTGWLPRGRQIDMGHVLFCSGSGWSLCEYHIWTSIIDDVKQ